MGKPWSQYLGTITTDQPFFRKARLSIVVLVDLAQFYNERCPRGLACQKNAKSADPSVDQRVGLVRRSTSVDLHTTLTCRGTDIFPGHSLTQLWPIRCGPTCCCGRPSRVAAAGSREGPREAAARNAFPFLPRARRGCTPALRASATVDEWGDLSDSPPIAEPHDRAGARSALVWAESYRCIASGGEVA